MINGNAAVRVLLLLPLRFHPTPYCMLEKRFGETVTHNNWTYLAYYVSRRMLGVVPRAASPTFIGNDSIENVELDPELAKIAQQVKVDVQRQTSLYPGSRSPSPANLGGPEIVELKVRWRKHPLNPQGRAGIWGFQMKRVGKRLSHERSQLTLPPQHDPFKILFEELADIAEVLVDNVIVTYEGKRIFASASPHGVGVWAQAELGMIQLLLS